MKYATGLVYKAQTVGDPDGEFLVRGKRRGTLVLVDGVPLNVRTGYYDLSSINLDDVERIEIVRGGGAVLYGSDATGGVINIITKKVRHNSVSLSAGNYGVQNHSVSVQADRFGLGASWTKKGEVDHTSEGTKYFNFYGGEKTVVSANYKINDALRLTADYNVYDYQRGYMNTIDDSPYDKRFITRKEYRFDLEYKMAGWDINAFYHKRTSDSIYNYWKKTKLYRDAYFYGSADTVKGLDISKTIQINKDTWVLGGKIYNEGYSYYNYYDPTYKKQSKIGYDYNRNVYSLFAQVDHQYDARNNMIIGCRETWTGSSPDGTNYNEFTPQIQYLHKIANNLSAYASIGKSFTLPTLTDMYGRSSVISNTSIKPEIGMHYEIGLKHTSGGHDWKLALFHSNVKDFITNYTDPDTGEDRAVNEDNKNTGIELTCDIKGKHGFSSNWGISYSNPMYKSDKENNGQWGRNYGRWLLNGGISYQKSKFGISLNGSFMGDRVMESSQEAVRPYFYTSMRLTYQPAKNQEVFLNVDNLLNRRDITSHVSSRYIALGRSFEIGYKVSF